MKYPASPALLAITATALTACSGNTQTGREPSIKHSPSSAVAAAGPASAQPVEELPATGPVPQYVIDDCLAALRRQIPERSMQVIQSTRGETSFIVDVKVEGVPNPWRCYHDSTKVTGTEYQGEG